MNAVTLVLVCFSAFAFAIAGVAPTQPSSPEAILHEIESLPRPDFDRSRSDDEKYVREYKDQMNRTWQRQAELELEFYRRFPNHPLAEQLLIRRWGNQLVGARNNSAVSAEVERFLRDHPEGPHSADDKLAFFRLRVRLADRADQILKLTEEFAKANPGNELAADFFMSAAEKMNAADRDAMFRRIINDYPSCPTAILAGGKLRKASQVGLPFILDFFDATTGKWVTTRGLRGKVVIIQFWATWCGPCVGEIPELKALYAKYRDRGLEILGVSLDGPGTETSLDTLRNFVQRHEINWPQYYQGEKL